LFNNNIKNKLQKISRGLPKAQCKVADYILKNFRKSAFLTIDKLAKEAEVSTTTVLRFLNNLGYSGYSEFLNEFRRNLLADQVPYDKFIKNITSLSNNNILLKNAKTYIDNVQMTLEMLDSKLLNNAVEMIFSASNIFIMGYRVSSVIVSYLYYEMKRMMDNCYKLSHDTVDFIEILSKIDKNSVVIAVNLPRYLLSPVTPFLETAKKRQAKTILITDSYKSPAAPYADILLPCFCKTQSFHNSIFGAIFISDCLISSLGIKNIKNTERKLKKAEELFKEYSRKPFFY